MDSILLFGRTKQNWINGQEFKELPNDMDQLKSESSNDQTEGLQQTQPIDSVADSDSPADSPKDSPTGYATIGKRITNFTTNLLATSVITMVALVAGSHFVSSLRPLTQATDDSI